MKRLLAFVLAAACVACGQSGDVLGAHDLSLSGGSHVKGTMSAACLYCHVPHSGAANGPLWGQTLSSQLYSTYISPTAQNTTTQPVLGEASSLCLSCHDGTVGVGQVYPYGPYTMSGKMSTETNMGTQLQGSHPFSMQLPIKDAADLVSSLASNGTTADNTGAVKLVKGNVECTSCHDPHNQYLDKQSLNFLVLANAKGTLCLACHTSSPRTVNGHDNPIALWPTSAHATSTNLVAPASTLPGGYSTVAEFACGSCHVQHNGANGSGLLAAANETDCITCHNGGNTLSPPAPNVFVEYGKQVVHPLSSSTGSHDLGESVLLNQNRHATCVDCHNAHATSAVTSFPLPPTIRVSQTNVAGISATDGVTVVKPAANQYENCLRCHGTSTGKTTNPAVFGYLPVWVAAAPDALNVIPQFSLSATSRHPVFTDRNSPLPQPSLRPNMMNLDGVTPGRGMGTRILCTDCHNADDNREFGGTGPNGPHGSKWPHVLERRYEFSQAPAPGATITNLFPTPDLGVNGPYALCAKCHDLNSVMANTSFSEHARHINDGFSCSTCHTSHGVATAPGAISGQRLVNFDGLVVAPNGAQISYTRTGTSNTCSLICHGHPH